VFVPAVEESAWLIDLAESQQAVGSVSAEQGRTLSDFTHLMRSMTRRMTVALVKSYDKYSENEGKINISEKAKCFRLIMDMLSNIAFKRTEQVCAMAVYQEFNKSIFYFPVLLILLHIGLLEALITASTQCFALKGVN